MAEGPKLVGELLAAGFEFVYVAVNESVFASFQALHTSCKAQVDIVTDEELKRVSTVDTPQGILAVVRQPQYSIDVQKVVQEGLCLALDDVQNPGNLGTIVRLADWFGVNDVFCSLSCADLYNPKTVQATMGAFAHVRVHYLDLVDLLKRVHGMTPVYGTFLDGENIYGKRLASKGLIVMGNEGRGISEAVAELVTDRLLIPSFAAEGCHVESLNVAIATAVVCAEFRRQTS